MKRVLAALLAGVVLLGGAAETAAHEAKAPAAISFAGAEERPDGRWVTVHARLETSATCRAGRRVRVLARYGIWTHRHVWAPGPWEPAGAARSGADGALAATVARPTLWSVKFKAPAAARGRGGHSHLCGGVAGALRFDLEQGSRPR
jgi:hypothetical protein